jgi:hypothetical protein
MSAFTDGLDVVLGEAYPSRGVEPVLAVRSMSGASWPAVLFAHGSTSGVPREELHPKGIHTDSPFEQIYLTINVRIHK